MYTKKSGRITFRSNRRQGFKRTVGYSNGKNRNRGNVSQLYQKYLKLAKEASSSGDRIQTEYYFQFADHYSRVAIESGMEVNLLKSEDSESLVEKDSIDKDITENNLKDKEIVDEKNVEELEDQNENTLDSVAFLKK